MNVREAIEKITELEEIIRDIDDGEIFQPYKRDKVMDYLEEYKELLENMKVVNK